MRKALRLLLNRELMIEKLFFNEYVPHELVLRGRHLRESEQPEERVRPAAGAEAARRGRLDDRDAQGRLTKNGQPLSIELLYDDKGSERWMTVFQEDLRKVGIGLNLRLVTPETLFKLLMERKFDVVAIGMDGG